MNISNWNLLRSFLQVAERGSLAAAARALELSQATLTRDIQALEHETGLNLFRRTTRGMELTTQGRGLVESAGSMQEAFDRFSRQASGYSEELIGEVRISANEIIGRYLLPNAVVALREHHPQLQVELVIDNHVSSLNKREADIAFRMFRPSQPDLVSRRLPDMELGFFAHEDYVKRHGVPRSLAELPQFSFITEDKDQTFLEGAAALGLDFMRNDFYLRTDDFATQIQLARAGGGIVGMHKRMAEQCDELVPVLEDVMLPVVELWLVCHSDVQFNARIRETMHFLGDWFAEDVYRGMMV